MREEREGGREGVGGREEESVREEREGGREKERRGGGEGESVREERGREVDSGC